MLTGYSPVNTVYPCASVDVILIEVFSGKRQRCCGTVMNNYFCEVSLIYSVKYIYSKTIWFLMHRMQIIHAFPTETGGLSVHMGVGFLGIFRKLKQNSVQKQTTDELKQDRVLLCVCFVCFLLMWHA